MYNKFYNKIIIIILILILFKILNNRYFNEYLNKKLVLHNSNYLKRNGFYEFFNSTIKNNTILILELRLFHHECTPGYTKYFIDLGYNVDILIHISGFDSLSLYPENLNIRLFIFNNITQILTATTNLSFIIKKYNFVLLQTTNRNKLWLYNKLGLFNLNNIIFVFHDINDANIKFYKYFSENRVWTLGNISKGLQVNPHYFGDIKIRDKNHKTKFFLTSTINRNYTDLINAVNLLKNENFDFKIIITGRSKSFNLSCVPKVIKDYFIFKGRVSYSELYQEVDSTDFIIIPLNPKNEYDNLFRTTRVSGSIQLVYGFLKPCIINREFAYFYNLNNKNSLIYNNLNLYIAMKKAILINNREYKNLQNHLHSIENKIFRESIMNIKRVIPEI